jgi:hypothetical protein
MFDKQQLLTLARRLRATDATHFRDFFGHGEVLLEMARRVWLRVCPSLGLAHFC